MKTFLHARRAVLSGALLLSAWSQASAQHVHDAPARTSLRLGAHAVGLLTHVSPILAGDAKTEAYLTQPTLLGEAHLFGGALQAQAAISFEAQTIERGELGAGNHGEGYIDRRHPHTYLHELVVSGIHGIGGVTGSLTVGRGFAPFGTDDPMMRPFVKFPVNHHLAQVLERLIVVAGLRHGAFMVEAGVFNGNEPMSASDRGSLDRFGDSWASRVTIMPRAGVEFQASMAEVESPELPLGGGPGQRKHSAAARYEQGPLYGLAEWSRTAVRDDGEELYTLSSMLLEATLDYRGWRPGVRLEHTERAEDERTADPFRTPWPHADTHVMGFTDWTIIGARLERALSLGRFTLAPFVEGSFTHVRGGEDDLFVPEEFFGSNEIWTLNLGARVSVGAHRARMGRYGVAAPSHDQIH
jgi:hypothetical protein